MVFTRRGPRQKVDWSGNMVLSSCFSKRLGSSPLTLTAWLLWPHWVSGFYFILCLDVVLALSLSVSPSHHLFNLFPPGKLRHYSDALHVYNDLLPSAQENITHSPHPPGGITEAQRE